MGILSSWMTIYSMFGAITENGPHDRSRFEQFYIIP